MVSSFSNRRKYVRFAYLRFFVVCSPPVPFYSVQARVTGCIQFKGIRKLLYTEAEKHLGYCVDGTHQECIKYDGQDLVLQLGFKQEERALGFENLLWELGRGEIVRSLVGNVAHVKVGCITAAQLGDRISGNLYDADAADSPALTLEGAPSAASSSRSSNHTIAVDSDLARYQSIEHPTLFGVGGVDEAHIWPQSQCSRAQRDDPNNKLALSKILHAAFDGPHGGFKHGTPTIAIRPVNMTAPPAVPGTRQSVRIVVECQDVAVAGWLAGNLKDGTERVGPAAFHTWVQVTDPQAFCGYLEKYYAEATRNWTVP
jgi:hypothetical protein